MYPQVGGRTNGLVNHLSSNCICNQCHEDCATNKNVYDSHVIAFIDGLKFYVCTCDSGKILEMAKFSEFGVLELNSYQKVSLKAIKGAETFLFSFPPGLGSGYVSRVCHLPVHQCTLVEDAQSILLVVKPTNLIMVDQCTSLAKSSISAVYKSTMSKRMKK